MSLFAGGRTRGLWWFRVGGVGLHWKDVRLHRELYSERNGYHRMLRVGPWRFRLLRRRRR